MIDLEHALTDLGEHLDYPMSESAATELRHRLEESTPIVQRHRGRSALLVAAAVFALVSVGVVAIAPARHAVADWLGIGAVEVRRTDAPPRTAPPSDRTVPGARGTGAVANAERRLAAARRVVRFPITTPRADSAGALRSVTVDTQTSGGLVALAYPRFTLVEIATDPEEQPSFLGKIIASNDTVERVTVAGRPGYWIGSTHEIGYLDRSRAYKKDSVRRSGPVLLWERDGVTYRIEGLRTQAEAQAIAAQLH